MSKTRETIVLSGASGSLGAAIRHALAEREMAMLQLVRSEPAGDGQVRWDPMAKEPLPDRARLEGCSCAIHLSGANIAARRWTAAYRREIAESRVNSTRALATVLAGLERPPRTLLAASAVGIYGDRGDQVLDESSTPGSGFLAGVCEQWEAAAEPAVKAGIRLVNLRFGVVLGGGSGALASMLPLFRMGLGGRLGSGRQWMSWISVADAVGAILFAMDRQEIAGPVNLTAPKPVTNVELTRALARRLQKPALLPAPAFALRLALGPMADEALLASARVVPTRLVAAGFEFKHPTVEQALAAALN